MTENHDDERLSSTLRSLGDRVRAMRLARGMSLEALSFEAELSEQRIRSIEAGRTAPPLAVLVALAHVFEVGMADLFGDAIARATAPDGIDAPSASPHVVPSPVIWGGELPPAPWMASAAGASAPPPSEPSSIADTVSRPVPSPAESFSQGPGAPVEQRAEPVRPSTSRQVPAPEHGVSPGEDRPVVSRGEPRPTSPDVVAISDDIPHPHAPSVAPRVHRRAAERGMKEASAYVFVAPGAESRIAPRTFADLRVGPLAGKSFRSLQEFAVASVVEGGYEIPDVARVFRVPVWRLEQWVRESGHAV